MRKTLKGYQRIRIARTDRTSIRDRILNQMREHGIQVPGDNSEYTLHRTHAGHLQRAAGAWSWFIRRDVQRSGEPASQELVGSCAPARECAKPGARIYPNRHSAGNWEMDPACDCPPVSKRT